MFTPLNLIGRHGQSGSSLLNALISCAVLALLLQQALPAMTRIEQRQRIQAHAHQVRSDLQWAKSEAQRLQRSLRVGFAAEHEGSGYLIFEGAKGSCQFVGGRAQCDAEGRLLREVWWGESARMRLRSNVSGIRIDARQGMLTPTGHIDITSAATQAGVRHVLSITGRIRTCGTDSQFSHLPGCKP